MVLVFALFSCGNRRQADGKVSEKALNESLEKANRYLVRTEEEEIVEYVLRYGDKMVETGTGLRYLILNKGEGEKVKKGDVVSLEYDLYDLKGNIIYSSDDEGVKHFIVGKGGVESGLEEAVLNFRQGDIAKIIIPSHLGFGLLGDQNRIGAKQTLVYVVKVVDIQKIK